MTSLLLLGIGFMAGSIVTVKVQNMAYRLVRKIQRWGR